MKKTALLSNLKLYTAITAGLVATDKAANAAIVPTDIPDVTRGDNTNFSIDLNNDGINDVRISQTFRVFYGMTTIALYAEAGSANTTRFVRNAANASAVARLDSGAVIGASSLFTSTSTGTMGGNFGNVYSWSQGATDKYVGVQFNIGANVHYGWVLMSVASNVRSYTIKAYAFENVPGKEINAGATVYTTPVLSAGSITATDMADNGSASDIRVNFVKATNETGILKYRILVVPSVNAATFDLAKALNTPVKSYHEVSPTGIDQSVTLPDTLLDTQGNAIVNGTPYNIFIASIASTPATSSISGSSNSFTLSPVLGLEASYINSLNMYMANNTLVLKGLSGVRRMEIVNSAGIVLTSTELTEGDNHIDVSAINELFIVRMIHNGKFETRKFIKN